MTKRSKRATQNIRLRRSTHPDQDHTMPNEEQPEIYDHQSEQENAEVESWTSDEGRCTDCGFFNCRCEHDDDQSNEAST